MFLMWILLIIPQYTVNGVEYNIAINQSITSSSVVANHPAAMVADLKLRTYVQVNYEEGVPAWIQFDLSLYTLYLSKIIIWPTDDADFILAKVSVYLKYIDSIVQNSKDYSCTFDNPVRGVPYNCSVKNNYEDFHLYKRPSNYNGLRRIGYVLLIKENYFSTETLKIAEVAIIASSNKYHIKKWKLLQQSNSIFGAGPNGPKNAIDTDSNVMLSTLFINYDQIITDDMSTCIYTDQRDVSKLNIRAWWRADLGKSYLVTGFYINDEYSKNQSYRGNYMLYADSDGFTKQNLCAFDNRPKKSLIEFLKCTHPIIGRYITVERIVQNASDAKSNRLDMLSFCHISLEVTVNESVYTYPQNYNAIETDKENISIDPQAVDLQANFTCPAAVYDKQLITWIIVGVVPAVVFAIIGFAIGSRCQKKKKHFSKNGATLLEQDNAYEFSVQ